jgi:hypothetical protein
MKVKDLLATIQHMITIGEIQLESDVQFQQHALQDITPVDTLSVIYEEDGAGIETLLLCGED